MSDDVDPQELEEELEISSDLPREFTMQAAHYSHYHSAYARALQRVAELEEKRDLLFSKLYALYKETHRDAKENDCKSHIRQQKSYQLTQKELRQAAYEADVLKGAIKGWEQRKDMLVQLGAARRKEEEQYELGGPRATQGSRRDKVKRASELVKKTYRRSIKKG